MSTSCKKKKKKTQKKKEERKKREISAPVPPNTKQIQVNDLNQQATVDWYLKEKPTHRISTKIVHNDLKISVFFFFFN